MTRGIRAAVALSLAATFATMPAWSLDLAEAYRLALDNDSTIRGSRAAADAGRERLPQAQSQLFPQVSASSSRYKNNLESTAPDFAGRPATTEDKYTSSSNSLTVKQPLFRPQLTAQVRQARALALNADKLLERDLQTLVTRVTESYFQTLLAEEQLALIGVQKAAYTGQLDAARKGFAAGAGTRTDIDEAQARLDLTVAQELEARQNVDLARRQLQVLINRPVDKVAPVDVRKLPLTGPGLNSIDEWTERAVAASPEIQSLAAQAEAARHQVDVAKSGHLPTLDAIGQISRSNSENITRINSKYNQRQLGLQLQVPIFQGGYVNSQVREALARQELANETLEAGRRDLGVRVHKEFRGVTEGVLKVRALEQAVRSAEQLVTSSNRSFQAGARTRIDILNAEQQLGTARRDLAQARFLYLISRVRLKALAGDLMPENIDEINGWLQR
jgi:outer membrane protein/protease secretion system outer membrane protein